MRKFLTLLSNEFAGALRHPNREVIPVLVFGLLSYLGLDLGVRNIIPEIQGTPAVTWYIPTVIAFMMMAMPFLQANEKIRKKAESGYLEHLRSTSTSPWVFVGAFVADAVVVSFAKTLILLAIYGILFTELGGFLPWVGILAVAILSGIAWSSLGIVVGLLRREQPGNSHLSAEALIPLLVITGLLYPVMVYPEHFEIVALVLPSTQAFELTRSMFGILEYQGWMLAALLGWGAAMLSLAVYSLHREDRR
ncbi:MAG: ABC transporter permease [Candidatus Marinimicrobia bacterium]|nr:ABC transporter permease [Candidatus Neomarinimicrobiota bacterium]MCF7829679.1 ABC transporter permease [Candidatus Neomarinimicrobiota bacterium]MCF7879839.1 ABC transporter permease [Candidatus Neomarinimicrobiota bacterium]